jgi:hypothetical protein
MHEIPRRIADFQEIIDGKTGLHFDAIQLGALALVLEQESHRKFAEEADPWWGDDISIMQSHAARKAVEMDPTAPIYDMQTIIDEESDLALAA